MKSEKKEEEIYSKSFGGEYKVQQANCNKVGLRLDLSSEKNSLEEDPISTSLKDKPIFGSAGSQFDHSNIMNYILRRNLKWTVRHLSLEHINRHDFKQG